MRYTQDDILELNSRYRAHLINSLTGFKSVVLCGTSNSSGIHNLSILSSLVHLGSNPPLYGLIFRPETVRRDTLANIRETGYFTLNHIHEGMYKEAHQTSASYEANESEFDAVGLVPECHADFPAPFVEESRIKLGMRSVREVPIVENGTVMVIGEIVSIDLPDEILAEDGYAVISDAGSLTVSGVDAYHSTVKLARLSYAKPSAHVGSEASFYSTPPKR
ncbi:MAG: flavin reductase [Oceanospirillaceae bacterium]|nr:flavin reductase [Oceanospirillaceae bacterium]